MNRHPNIAFVGGTVIIAIMVMAAFANVANAGLLYSKSKSAEATTEEIKGTGDKKAEVEADDRLFISHPAHHRHRGDLRSVTSWLSPLIFRDTKRTIRDLRRTIAKRRSLGSPSLTLAAPVSVGLTTAANQSRTWGHGPARRTTFSPSDAVSDPNKFVAYTSLERMHQLF